MLACARHPASAASRATFLNPPSAYVPLPTAPHLAPVHVVPALCPTLPHAVLMARTQQQRRPPPAATRDPLGRPWVQFPQLPFLRTVVLLTVL